MPARKIEEPQDDALAVSAPLLARRDADIEDVRLARRARKDAVADDLGRPREHPAIVTGAQAIVEDAVRPRERVRGHFDRGHALEILRPHRPEVRKRFLENGDHVRPCYRDWSPKTPPSRRPHFRYAARRGSCQPGPAPPFASVRARRLSSLQSARFAA